MSLSARGAELFLQLCAQQGRALSLAMSEEHRRQRAALLEVLHPGQDMAVAVEGDKGADVELVKEQLASALLAAQSGCCHNDDGGQAGPIGVHVAEASDTTDNVKASIDGVAGSGGFVGIEADYDVNGTASLVLDEGLAAGDAAGEPARGGGQHTSARSGLEAKGRTAGEAPADSAARQHVHVDSSAEKDPVNNDLAGAGAAGAGGLALLEGEAPHGERGERRSHSAMGSPRSGLQVGVTTKPSVAPSSVAAEAATPDAANTEMSTTESDTHVEEQSPPLSIEEIVDRAERREQLLLAGDGDMEWEQEVDASEYEAEYFGHYREHRAFSDARGVAETQSATHLAEDRRAAAEGDRGRPSCEPAASGGRLRIWPGSRSALRAAAVTTQREDTQHQDQTRRRRGRDEGPPQERQKVDMEVTGAAGLEVRRRCARRPREPLPQPPPRAASGDVPPPEVQDVLTTLWEGGMEATAYRDEHGNWGISASGSIAGALVEAGLANYA